jgi:superfamily II DNA helicase RecQ
MIILQSSNMIGFGLQTMVINADTTAQAQTTKRNLWYEAQTDPDIILLSPEELGSWECFQLLNNLAFSSRVCILGIDEFHLLYWWGKSFRPAYQQIGVIRARLPLRGGHQIPIMGISATLREGPPMESIHEVLGLIHGRYHLIGRFNMRHDIQIICRQMQSGIGGTSFPELEWVLDSENTVIFCKTIALGFRLACYFWWRAKSKGISNLPSRLHLFNSLNWASFNTTTFGFLNNNISSSITIDTDVLSIGWDSKFT